MTTLAFAGCGALGSWTAMLLAGNLEVDRVYLFDDDRIEEGNLGTTPYMSHQIGVFKVDALAEMLYRKGWDAVPHRGTVGSHKDIYHKDSISLSHLVVDTFDNREARLCTFLPEIEGRLWHTTLHAGVSEGRTGSVLWHPWWTPPPDDGLPRGHNPVCTRHLGAQILQVTAAYTASVIRTWARDNTYVNYPLILEGGRAIT